MAEIPLPEAVQTLVDDALDALDSDQPRKALRLVDEALEKVPDAPQLVPIRAEILVQADRADEARRWLEELLARNRDLHVQLAAMGALVDLFSDDYDLAAECVEKSVQLERVAQMASDLDAAGAFAWLRGQALAAMGEPVEAAKALELARTMLGDDDHLLLDIALSRFELFRFGEAKALLDEVLDRHPDEYPEAWYFLGRVAERTGDQKTAETHFARARDLAPDQFPPAFSLPEKEFDAAVELALSKLPDDVAEYLENVPVIVEPWPPAPPEGRTAEITALAVGELRGPNIREGAREPGQVPTAVVLYRRNLEHTVTTRGELVDEIEVTVLHEIGHYLGWDEAEVHSHGLG